MVDCDVRTRQHGLTSLHRPGQLLCADGHAIAIAASSTVVQAAGRCTMDEGVERVVTATTASVYMHGFAIGRCGAGGECLGSLGDAIKVFTEVGNMDVRAQRVRGRSTSRGTFGSGPLSTSRCGQ